MYVKFNFSQYVSRLRRHVAGKVIAATLLILMASLPISAMQINAHNSYAALSTDLKISIVQAEEDLLVTIDAKDVVLSKAIKKITDHIGVGFSYTDSPDLKQKVSANFTNTPLYQVLGSLLEGTNLEYLITPARDMLIVKEMGIEKIEPGSISGIVVDQSTGEPMPGATIALANTRFGAATDANGRFIIRSVPAGEYTAVIRFLGYSRYEKEIEVRGGERQTLNAEMQENFIMGEDVVVTAIQRGQSRSFTQMRQADNVRNVVSAEQMERFPDPTIAGALQRLPGISTVHDRGEAGSVMIRGLGAGFGNVTIDGQRMPSTSRTGRDTDVRGISIDMISSVEVHKTFTPDMNADAVSGSINLNTRRPIGTETIFNATASSGYNNSIGSINPNDLNYHAGLTYGQRTSRLSYVVNASFRRDNRLQQDLRHRWGAQDFNGDGVPQDVLTRLEPSLYPIDRKRYNFSANLDYYPSDNSSYSLRATYSRRDNMNNRIRVTNRLDRGSYELTEEGRGITTGDRGRFDYRARFDPRTTEMYTINAGGEHTFDAFNLDYRVAYSYGFDGAREGNYRYQFRADGGFNYEYDINNRQAGEVTFLGQDLTPSDVVMRNFYQSPNYGTNHETSAKFNLEFPYRLSNSEGSIKTGGDIRWSLKDRVRNRERFSFAEPITLADFQLGSRFDLRGNTGWAIPWYFDLDWADNNFMNTYGDRLIADEEYNAVYGSDQLFTNTEVIPAAYVMATHYFGNWMILGGVRAEYTAIDNQANQVEFDADGNVMGITPLNAKGSFLDIFPAFHLKYSFTDRTNLRASFTQTINRPNYRELSPYRVVDFDDEVLSIGNPELVSLRSSNYDLLFEHYFLNVGVVSAGLFYKSISDFTFTESSDLTSGDFDGWILEQPINGDEATVYGVELSWQQRLDFLPGELKGLGLFVNYAYTYSEADYGRDEKFPLPRQIPHVFNAALSYDKGGFSGMMSLNYQSRSFLSTSTRLPSNIAEREGAFPDRYRTSFTSLDFSANQRVARGTYVFVELKNLLDDSNMDYYLDERFPYRENWNSWTGQLGIRYRM